MGKIVMATAAEGRTAVENGAPAAADRNRGQRRSLLASALVPALGLALLAPPALADSLQAALSRDQVRVGETVDLLLRYRPDGASAGTAAPDLAPLQRDFRILDTRQSQRTVIVNGRRDASLDWVVTLTPRQAGATTVPALQVGDASSEALPLHVAAAPTPSARAAAADLPDLFLEAEVDRSDPYVQGQTVLTARIHDAAGMTAAALTDPQIPGAVVERLGEDRVYQARRGDRDYRVIERRFAVFPQSSGRLEIPPLRLEAQVPAADGGGFGRAGFGAGFPFARGGADPFADMFARMRQMGFGGSFGGDPFGAMSGQRRQVLSQPLTLEVRERPAADTADWFLPAEDVRLVEDWSADSFTAGAPVTRTITLMAKGLTGAQLPDLALPDAPGVKQYVEDDGRQTVTRGDGTLTARQTTISVVPSRAGTVALPEIRVAWWDVAADQQREAVLPARTLQVAAAPGSGSTAPTAGAAAPGPVEAAPAAAVPDAAGQGRFSTSAWLPDRAAGLAAGAGLLLLGAGGFLLLRRRRTAALPAGLSPRKGAPGSRNRAAAHREGLGRAEAALAQACAAGHAAAALDALAQWGRACWPENPPRGAAAVAARLQAEALEQAVRAVTRRLYGDAGSEPGRQPPAADLAALHDAFRAARFRVGRRLGPRFGLRDDGQAVGPLPSLYPPAGGRA